jgi:predicted enzyme related to lactoylglutathione lyase
MIGDFAPSPRAGERSRWVASVAVPDVDAAARTATQLGGKIVHGPSDIPGVGRVAQITDPQGAELSLLTRTAGDTANLPPAHGRWNWNELHTTDPAAAIAFYAGVVGFGHRAVEGPDGAYHVLSTEGVERGGVTDTLAPGTSPHWLPYISVTSANETLARASGVGGKVRIGPFDIPGIGRFGVLEDPAGAVFAVLQALPRTA